MRKKAQSRVLSLVVAICMLLGSLTAVNIVAADELTEQDGYYLIYTADDLFAFNAIVNTISGNNNKNAKLMANIDLKNEPWTPLGLFSDYADSKGPYSGVFDGNGYVISNLYVEVDTQHETGFFGRLSGTAKNLGLVNATIINNAGIRAGIIAGDIVGGTAENVFTDGTVTTSHAQAGGLSGEIANGATLKNCYTTNPAMVVSFYGSNNTSNVFYVADEDTDSHDWSSVITDKEMFKTGEAAYVMNEKIGSTVWYQNLDNGSDVDAWPVGVNTHGIVYRVNETLCPGVSETKVVYSNANEDKVATMHTFEENMCAHCGKAFGADDITAMRTASLNEIKAYVNYELYREAQVAEIEVIIDEAETALGNCSDATGMNTIVADTKVKIDAIKTDDELLRDDLKPTADAKIQALKDSVDYALYRTAQVTAINEIIAKKSEDIYEATTEIRINSLISKAEAEISVIPTDTDFNNGVALIEEGISDVFMSLYYDEQQSEIRNTVANGIAAVNAATTKEGITSVVNSTKNSINSIRTSEQVDFINMYSDASNGLLAYDGFVGNIGKIQGQSTGVGFMNTFDFEGNSYNNVQISMEQPMRYGNLLSSPKYFTYKNGDYRSGRAFSPWGDSSFDKAGVASEGYIGKNGSGLPVYMSFLMRTNGSGQNALEFHESNGFWHGGSRKFAVGSFNAEDGIESSSINGKNYWSLRVGPDGGDTNQIIRTNKEFKSDETVLVVLKLEFNYPEESKISMYLNPDLSMELPAVADAVATTKKDIRFRGMTNHANSKLDLDELRVGTSYEAVTPLATYKFPITKVIVKGDSDLIKGGTIMGSNESATSGFETIATIPEDITEGVVEITDITNTNSYRYVKYYGPKGTYGQLSELELYSGIRKLKGEAFATVPEEGHSAGDAFDGNVETYYKGQEANDQYVGLDLGGETAAAMPTTNIEPGRYEEALSIELSCSTEGAEIYYTTDGTTPTKLNGTLYDGTPIEVEMGSSILLKAIAFKQGLFDSDMLAVGFGAGADAPVPEGLQVFMIGNSLTDTVVNGTLTAVAQSAGFAHKCHKWTIPGAAMVWLKSHPGEGFGSWVANAELSLVQDEKYTDYHSTIEVKDENGNNVLDDNGDKVTETRYYDPTTATYTVEASAPLDVITVQPFGNGDYFTDSENENCLDSTTYFYDMARKYNPDIRFLIYSSWGALNNDIDSEEFEGSNAGYVAMNEKLADAMNELYPDGKEINIVPNTQALEELKRQISTGEFPGGVTDFTGFTSSVNEANGDRLHLSENGKFLIACTTFVTLYKTSPIGLIAYKPDSLTEEQALAMQKIAYDVNVNYEYSGVSVTYTTPKPTAVDSPSDATTMSPTLPDATPPANVPTTSATASASVTVTPTTSPTTTPNLNEPTPEPETRKVTKVKFAKKKIKVKVGKKTTLKVKLTPAKGLSKAAKKVNWSIDKKGKKVVKFVKTAKKLNGKLKVKIKAKKKGKAKVTCKAPGGKKAVCTITVK